jgi:Zn ribbon nucleic-acid-binding protein
MTGKKPKTGGEIDAYCTKCKLDLTHRIIAMVGDQVKKVECKTCGSHHLYRKPKTERDAEAAAAVKAGSTVRKSKSEGGPRTASERHAAAERAERERVSTWEKAIAGQPTNAFKPYSVKALLGAGELVHHPKFGDGVVARVIDRAKVEILFQDGPRTMAHGME